MRFCPHVSVANNKVYFLKILSFSYCFPNQQNPNWGMFVYQRLKALAKLEQLQVCSPVPWFPVLKKYAGSNVALDWQGLTVHRPGFFYLPGILKNADARFYAKGLKHWLQQYCEKSKLDLRDAQFVWPDGVGVALLAQELGIPYTITLRGKIYECLKVPSQASQCAEALKGAAAVISVSSPMAEEALRMSSVTE